MKVKLSPKEFNYIKVNNFIPERLQNMLIKSTPNEHSFYNVELSDDDADEIRNCCSDRLVEVGFENDEPTEAGLILESLIDKFYTG